MSSPRSPRLPEGVAELGAAAVRVAEESLYAYAEPCDAARAAALIQARNAAEPWLTASIAFAGPFDGVVSLTLPRALCVQLAGAFCGIPSESLDDVQIADFAGEVANMVCGSWLTQTHRADGFALTAPRVARAAAADVAAIDPEAVCLLVHDTPLLVGLAAGSVVGPS